MKAKNFGMLLLAGMFTFGLQSCDDNDDDRHITASPELEAAFSQIFPDVNASTVQWEWDGRQNAYEAEFWENRLEKSAWFSQAYEWLMTETDYEPPFTGVPQAVIDAANAQYPNYVLEDIDYIETPDDDYYRVEMEQGDRDVYLNIEEDGTLR